jgi:hypothetical protein
MSIEGILQEGFVTTTADKLINYMRTGSLWPMTFGLTGAGAEQHAETVDSILQLADAFSLRVIAEGVETIEQLKLLQQKQCHLAQGFLLSKPVEEETLIALLLEDIQTEQSEQAT